MSATMNADRPLPEINNKLYAPYFQALREQKLAAQHCEACGHIQMPPREFCFNCHSTRLEWKEVKQEGVLFTYTIVYRAFHPWFKDHLPYGVAVIETDDGIRFMGNYFDSDVESLECGMRMKCTFEKVNEEVTLLNWVKDD